MRYAPLLLVLLAGCAAANATVPDSRSLVATQLALASLAVDDVPAPTPDKPLRKDCQECNGSGRVRTGDGQGWTECEACIAPPQAPITILIPPAKPRAKPVVARQAVYYGGGNCSSGSCGAPQRLRLYVRKPVDRTRQAASGDCTDGSCGTGQSYSSGGRRRGGLLGRFFGR